MFYLWCNTNIQKSNTVFPKLLVWQYQLLPHIRTVVLVYKQELGVISYTSEWRKVILII